MFLALVFPALSGLLVNEVMYDPTGSETGADEWIELCNNGTESVDLTGYWVESGGTEFGSCFDITGGSIAPGEYLILGGSSTTHPGSFDPELQNGGGETDGLRLLAPDGTVVDTVLYDDDANSNGLVDDLGSSSSTPAPDVGEGHSLGRWPDCADTNVSGTDFVDYDVPSPGAANAEPEEEDTGDTGDTGGGTFADCSLAPYLTINELMPNPDGSGSDQEWIELYNGGSEAIDLGGWLVEWDTSSWDSASDFEFEAGTVVEAGGFLVVGYGGVEVSFSMGDAGSSADGVRIVCDGAAVDTVVYGDEDPGELTDDSGSLATSFAPSPSDGTALARFEDGRDTNMSGDDFVYASEPTPGAANKVPHCDPTGGEGLKVNEVVYDPSDDDDTYEWVELYNAGSVTIQLEGFQLEGAKSSWDNNATLPAELSLAPGEFFVIGGGDVPEQDYAADDLDLGNGTDGDGVRVLDCEGLVLDTVLYGDELADDITGDNGATDVVDDPGTGASFGRYPDGGDSDQHTDFFPYDTPSPGEPNADPGADTDGETGDTDDTDKTEDPPDGGCGPSADRPAGAECATTPGPLAGLAAGLAALLAARRRR